MKVISCVITKFPVLDLRIFSAGPFNSFGLISNRCQIDEVSKEGNGLHISFCIIIPYPENYLTMKFADNYVILNSCLLLHFTHWATTPWHVLLHLNLLYPCYSWHNKHNLLLTEWIYWLHFWIVPYYASKYPPNLLSSISFRYRAQWWLLDNLFKAISQIHPLRDSTLQGGGFVQ